MISFRDPRSIMMCGKNIHLLSRAIAAARAAALLKAGALKRVAALAIDAAGGVGLVSVLFLAKAAFWAERGSLTRLVSLGAAAGSWHMPLMHVTCMCVSPACREMGQSAA